LRAYTIYPQIGATWNLIGLKGVTSYVSMSTRRFLMSIPSQVSSLRLLGVVSLWMGFALWSEARSINAVIHAVQPTASTSGSLPSAQHTGKLAFASTRDGNWEIYVMEADGAHPRNFTQHPANDRYPAWSPDGRSIAFASNRGGDFDLYVMTADGKKVSRLTNGLVGNHIKPTWSPDGTRLAFDSSGKIALIDVNGSNYRLLTSPGRCSHDFPAWSPNGSTIAFMVVCNARGNDGEIYIMNVDGSNLRNLTNHPADDGLPAWSPDGQQIVFASNRHGNVAEHVELYVMRADGSAVRRLAKNQIGGHPSWSKDGRSIAFVSPVERSVQIFVMEVDGTHIRQLTHTKMTNWVPDWSPLPEKPR
jgi:TolB protein